MKYFFKLASLIVVLSITSSCAKGSPEPPSQTPKTPVQAEPQQQADTAQAGQPIAPQAATQQPAVALEAGQPAAPQSPAQQPAAAKAPTPPAGDPKAKTQEATAEGRERLMGEGIIRTFWGLVDRGNSDTAAVLIDPSAGGQGKWKESLSSIGSAKVGSVSPHEKASWKEGEERYKVEISIKCKPENPSGSSSNRCGGWNDGVNTRLMTVKKTPRGARIAEIATGQ